MNFETQLTGDVTLLMHRLFHFGFTYGDYSHMANKLPDFSGFSAEVVSLAAKYENYALNAEKKGLFISARHYYDMAARYYHFSQLFVPPFLPVKEQSRIKSRNAFKLMSHYMEPNLQFFRFPYKQIEFPGYLHLFDKDAPTVFFINGLDSSKEVELATFARDFFERGMNVIAFDGPGQGEMRSIFPMNRNNHAEAFSALIDYSIERYSINKDKLGVFGVSFGGYLAPRAAAHDQRIKACISLSGPYSYDLAYTPPIVLEDFKEQFALKDAKSMDDFKDLISLDDIKDKLNCPTYVVIGEKDHLLKEEEKDKLQNLLNVTGGEVMRIPQAEHVCSSFHAEILPLLADWMMIKLMKSIITNEKE